MARASLDNAAPEASRVTMQRRGNPSAGSRLVRSKCARALPDRVQELRLPGAGGAGGEARLARPS